MFGAGSAQAATVTFDFESLALGTYTSIVQTVDGLTLSLARETADPFDITSLAGSAPASWGNRSISPFIDLSNSAFIANFSSLLSSFMISAGDFTPSDLDTLMIQAYSGPNATGSLLATFSQSCCDTGDGFVSITGSVAAVNIGSVRFIGGSSDFPNSLFYDNIVVNTSAVTAVPEPATLFLLGTGLAAAARARRKRQAL
jgi:hypothetical protein